MPIIVPEGTDKQDEDPTDAQVPVTDAERDRWRRIVAAQRKDISDPCPPTIVGFDPGILLGDVGWRARATRR